MRGRAAACWRLPLLAALLVAAAALGGVGAERRPTIAGCPVFPADSAWNRRVDALARRAQLARR